MNIILKEHPVDIEINGNNYTIDAGLSMSDVEKICSVKNHDSNGIVAGIIASKIEEKHGISLTKEQILSKGDSILSAFLSRVPHLQDFSSEGFQTADEFVNHVKDHYAKLSLKFKNNLPKMPDYSNLFMPSPERIKEIGDSLRFEQERKREEYEARESTKETASNTAELLAAITEIKTENKESNKKQHRVNVATIMIGIFTLGATIVFGIINNQNVKQKDSLVSGTYSIDEDSVSPKEEMFTPDEDFSSRQEDLSDLIEN